MMLRHMKMTREQYEMYVQKVEAAREWCAAVVLWCGVVLWCAAVVLWCAAVVLLCGVVLWCGTVVCCCGTLV